MDYCRGILAARRLKGMRKSNMPAREGSLMTFTEGLLKARSHIIFLLGLIVAFGIVIRLETWDIQRQPGAALRIPKTASIPTVSPTALSPQEQQWARVAWQYFVNNYQLATGLVNSVDRYPASTMWD